MAADAEDAEQIAGEMLGMTLVTPQTGPAGRVVGRLLVEEGLDLASELYLGVLVDRAAGRPVMMASAAGGMEIEAVAAETPELIHKMHVDPALGLVPFQARKLADAVGLSGAAARAAAALMQARLCRVHDRRRVSGRDQPPGGDHRPVTVLALDAKVTLDDNASFRHGDLAELRDLAEEEPLEIEASRHALNYIRLDGNIGCMVNGAGLAMATMDIIKLAGGEPANFLDVGGGANAEQIRNAFRILLSDTKVRAVLINIFGGILRCDVLAAGVIAAVTELGVRRAGRHPDGRDERRGGAAHARGQRAELHHRRHHGTRRRGRSSRSRAKPRVIVRVIVPVAPSAFPRYSGEMAVLIDERDSAPRSGPDRAGGRLSRPPGHRVRHRTSWAG